LQSWWVWTFCIWLMLSSPNTCLIIARASIALFRDLHKIWCCSFLRSIAKSHQGRNKTPNKRM
jgi:hypothetical protein